LYIFTFKDKTYYNESTAVTVSTLNKEKSVKTTNLSFYTNCSFWKLL